MSAWPFLLFQKPMPAVWPFWTGPLGCRPLAVVVVQAVDPLAELDEELVGHGRGEAAAGRADAVDPLRVAGRLGRLGQVVTAGPQVEEDVGAVAVGLEGSIDGVAEVVGAGQGDGHAADAVLAEVDLAVVVEVREDGARQAGRRQNVQGAGPGAGQEIAVAAISGDDSVAAHGQGAGAQRRRAVDEGDAAKVG